MNISTIRENLYNNFPLYAETCLKIRTKQDGIRPFKLNKAQIYIHKKLEEQKRTTGKVRAVILKGRQQGCSTYIAGRYYHAVTQREGAKVFILTHREDATNNLYNLVKNYHENIPPHMKAATSKMSAKELYFSELNSGYAIGTSGSGNVGRSDTIQLLHGSEVAFWDNTPQIATGIMQTVAEANNTEIILESTANGIGNMFHQYFMNAMNGLSNYQFIFVPWFWSDEYRIELPNDFELTEEEMEYKDAFELDDKQIYWRRVKIMNFPGKEWQFKQEYPSTPIEAFETSSDNSWISPESVLKARKNKRSFDEDSLVIGLDPAHMGNDKTAIVWRRGRSQFKHQLFEKLDTMEVVGRLINIIRNDNPEKVFVDIGGIGAGIYDRLKELGYGRLVTSVNFGSRPNNVERYFNKRAEMWGLMKEWLEDDCKIEDSDKFHSDLIGVQYTFDSNGKLKLESKKDMKKRGLKSPDLGDALALTFAMPVANKSFMAKYGGQTINKVNTTWDEWNL